MRHEHKLQIPEEVKAKIEKAKTHLKENRTTYLVGAGCLAAGYFLRKSTVITVVNEGVAPVVPAVINHINNNPIFNNTVNNGGHMRKIVRCLETDEMWSSVSKAAEASGHSISMMSKHINGHTDHLNGLHYVIEGLASG